ncbi:hypothetical protein LCGC14_1354480 [marine sediment metagenome]|uniref:Uncharacterized protein n=1 Tax=marine sediment metagenome TaxID=412755 RepID=A0A0F9KW14_9ZZZZ
MSKFIGRLANIGIAKEDVRGTPVDATFWLAKVALTLDDKITQAIDGASTGVIEDSNDANVTEKFSEGTIEGMIRAEDFGLLLLSTLGAVVSNVDTPEAGVQTHDFTVLETAQHPSLTFSIDEPNAEKRHALGMITSLDIAVALNEYASFTAGIRAQLGVVSSLTPAYVEADQRKIFLPQHGTFKTAADLAGLGAAPAIEIKGFNLSISKNVEDDQTIGSLSPTDILNKQFAVEGTVEIMYENTDFIDELLADTPKAMRLTLANTDITIGSSSNPTLEIDLARVKFSEVTKPFPNDDLVVQTISFKGHYDLSDAALIKVKLINETISY